MKKATRITALTLVLIVTLSAPSYAWNARGHMMVAFVAYQQLNPATKQRVDALLRRNPDRPNWLKLIPAGTSAVDKKMMIFMIAATWPDRIKSLSRFKDEDPSNPNRPNGASTNTQNIGYRDHFKHKYWHFIDEPFTTDNTPLDPIPDPNAQTQIAVFRLVLSDENSPDRLKSYDLSWLLHLVGDVHQPLHCTARFSQDPTLLHGDAGGNLATLCVLPCRNNLHSFWDDVLGTGNSVTAAATAGATLPPATGSLNDLDAAHWIQESFDIAKARVYEAPSIGVGGGPFTLTVDYKDHAKGIAIERVALAGARLAKILNDELR